MKSIAFCLKIRVSVCSETMSFYAATWEEAIKLVETHQDRLSQDTLQITFDQHRREVYEAAIAFEYDQTGCEESWNLAQRYKAKLFLNSLQRFGPAAAGGALNGERLSLSQVQKRIPGSVQIVDYMVMSNQLLIWVISKNNFDCRSVAVNAHELQEKIDLFLSQLRQRQPSERSSRDLYDVLVEPIEKRRTLCALYPMQTRVIVPSLHHCCAKLCGQRLLKKRNVFIHQLLLQILGAGRDNYASPAAARRRDRRH